MRRIIIVLVFFVLAVIASAQSSKSFRYYDSLTFAQYNSAEWKLLSSSASGALSEGYDYYYLRMRIGISYYERSKYLLAIKHFKKALEFNKGDQIALEYLYYCYYFSNNLLQARALSAEFGPSLKDKTAVESNKNRISFDYLYFEANTEDIRSLSIENSPLADAGTFVIPISYMNAGVSLYHNLKPGNSITHSLSYLGRKNTMWTGNGTQIIPDFEQNVKQVQYTFSPAFASRKGVLFAPMAFYINTSYNILEFASMGGGGSTAYQSPVRENNIGGGFLISASPGLVDVSATAYISRLGRIGHAQFGASLMFYPLANKKLSFGLGYSNKRSYINEVWEAADVLETKIGFSVRNRFFVDFTALFGELNNYIDNNGFVIYNGINKLGRVLKADVSFVTGQSGMIIYAGARTSEEFTAFIPENYIYSTISENKFNSISILGGISWRF